MSKIVHISLFKARENDGTMHLGGVEQFGIYLQRAIPDLTLLSWRDFPAFPDYNDQPDYMKAKVMGDWLSSRKIVDQDTIAIVDGYWGLGLEEAVGRLVSVVHGSYYGRMMRSHVHHWGEFVDFNHVSAQIELWEHPKCEVVAVAEESAREVHRAGVDKEIAVIYHGVDLETYKPLPDHGELWMHGATSTRKGLHIINTLNMMEKGLQVVDMDEHSGDPARKCRRINEAQCLIMPSAHEGNSYLLLEFLACGVPAIIYATGLALEMDVRCGIIVDDLAPANFYRHMKGFDVINHDPRAWMEQHGSFDRFAQDWRKYLGIAE